MPRTISTEDWIGQRFANGWEIIRKISKEEEKELGMGTHNAHFECYNHNCGITTCIEKTTLNGYLKSPRDVLYNCRRCNPETCKYKDKVRKQVGRDSVVADYSKKVKVGQVYGLFEVLEIKPSTEFGEHQSRGIVKCRLCGKTRECLFHHLTNKNVACECFGNQSTGERLVSEWLKEHNIKYKFQLIYDDLKDVNVLRYDFGIYGDNNKIIKIVEFDGEQHFQEPGSFYNPDGLVQKHDKMKNEYAAKHNIPLLRIPYTEVLNMDKLLTDFLL